MAATETAPILNLGRIRKSISGGIAGAVLFAGGESLAGGSNVITWLVPADHLDQIPWWAFVIAKALVGVVGFVVGFAGVYVTKPNDEPLPVAPEGTKVVPEAAVVVTEKKEKAA